MAAEVAPLTPAMSVSARLDRCRSDVPGLGLVAYGDLGSRLILRSSSDRPWPRERLDALCDGAAWHLRGDRADILARHAGGPPRLAISMTPGETRVFVTDGVDDGDMLCAVGDGRADVCAVIRAADLALRDVTDG